MQSLKQESACRVTLQISQKKTPQANPWIYGEIFYKTYFYFNHKTIWILFVKTKETKHSVDWDWGICQIAKYPENSLEKNPQKIRIKGIYQIAKDANDSLEKNPKEVRVRIKMVLTFHNSKKLANILLQNFSVMQILKKQRLGLRNLPDCKRRQKHLRKKIRRRFERIL